MKINKTNISDKTLALSGAVAATAIVFAYSFIVMIYAIVRSSLTIYDIMPKEERNTILLISGFSIAYSVAVFSLLMALFSSLAGSVTIIVLKKLLQYFNPGFYVKKAILLSAMLAVVLIGLFYLPLYFLLRKAGTFDAYETAFFWFYLPAVIFFVLCIKGGFEINRVIRTASKPSMN